MPVFRATTTVQLARVTGFDLYGEAVLSAPISVPVAVVDFKPVIVKTPIRSGSSASRGRLDEGQEKAAKILFPATGLGSDVSVSDRVTFAGVELEVMGVNPRIRMSGDVDHLEVMLRLVVKA